MKLHLLLFLATVAVLTGPPLRLSAQDDDNGSEESSEGYSYAPFEARDIQYIGAGLQLFDLSGLDAAFTDAGLSSPSLNVFEVTAGTETFHLGNRRLVQSSEFGYQSSTYQDYTDGSARLEALGFNYYLGYAVVRTQRVVLSPLLGFGRHWTWISLRQNDLAPASSNAFLLAPGTEGRIKSNHWTFRSALDFQWLFPQGDFSLGLRAGYQISADRTWESSNGTINGLPSDNRSGFFVQLLFGQLLQK